MSADPVVYCLEHLTDYPQFERLASDVMNQSGFKDIEPLGGSRDRGRDALHISRTDPNDITIFAYSVRGDWQQKLSDDCKRIQEEKHVLHRLVFVSTAAISTTERDDAKQRVLDKFAWSLELYDLERLRVRLTGDLAYLIARHPAIFCPPIFPTRGGISISESRDTLLVDHVPADHAVATWLARRLQTVGYRTWCYGTAPLAGESADDSVRALIDKRAIRYLPVLSPSSIGDADFLSRCAVASATEGLVVPCVAKEFDPRSLPSKLRGLTPVSFAGGFSQGLNCLLASLGANAIRPALDVAQGRSIALRSYMPQPVTRPVPEQVYTNTFAVTVPGGVVVSNLAEPVSAQQMVALRKEWAFCEASPRTLLGFERAPAWVPLHGNGRPPAYDWSHFADIEGKRSVDVVKELTRRALDVACHRAGLLWCDNRRVYYFSHEGKPQRTVSYVHVDGRRTRVAVTGEKSYGSGEHAVPFRYQLAPTFRVGLDPDGRWWVTLRIYVRITDPAGTPLEKKSIIRWRKKVTKSWWNKEWLARTLGVIQALANHGDEIVIGGAGADVRVNTNPLSWQCPVSIDYRALEQVGDFQEELAGLRYVDAEGDESNESDEG